MADRGRRPNFVAIRHQGRISLRRVFFWAAIALVFQLSLGVVPARSESKDALVLRVDERNEVITGLFAGLPYIVSVAGSFGFYDSENRNAIVASGPWKGTLKSRLISAKFHHVLAGRDAVNGGESNIAFEKSGLGSVEITFRFTAPRAAKMLDAEILKLAGDMFAGAKIITDPQGRSDAPLVPPTPLSFDRRILLADKNKVVLRTSACDFEIVDLGNERSILLADFRNAPSDPRKSIYLGINARHVTPGKECVFKYRVRFLPRSEAVAAYGDRIRGETLPPFDVRSFFSSLRPKKEIRAEGFYTLKSTDILYGNHSEPAMLVLQSGLNRLTRYSFPVKPIGSFTNDSGIIVRQSPIGLLKEGFKIDVTPKRIVLTGADRRGCLYGVYELLSRFVCATNGRWGISCGSLSDWPDLGIRGMCLTMSKSPLHDVAFVKRLLSALSQSRCNTVIFLHTPAQIKAWQADINDGGWTKAELADMAEYSRSLCMDVWGGMTSGFSAETFKAANVMSGSNIYDPLNSRSYDILFSLYSQITQAYSPTTFLIAHDEIKGLNVYSRLYGKSPGRILADDVNKIHDWLSQKGIRTAMWGDMLLDHRVWAARTGNANSQNPEYDSGATHLAINQISRDVLILDWHYDKHPRYESVEYFSNRGFTVVGCPWYDPEVASLMAKNVSELNGAGVIGTDWGLLGTLSPASTTLYTPLCGWSTATQVDKSGKDIETLAQLLRPDVYDSIPTEGITVDLKKYATKSLSDRFFRDGSNLIDIGPLADLGALTGGEHMMGGVTFLINESDSYNQKNAVIVENQKSTGAHSNTTTTIDVFGQRASAIAFLQTALVESPQIQPRELGNYIVAYQTGRKIKVPLLENYNITDIRSAEGLRKHWCLVRKPDVLAGSVTAWRGLSKKGTPLNLQTFLWENPHPDEEIENISLVAAPSDQAVKIGLFGLTLLKKEPKKVNK